MCACVPPRLHHYRLEGAHDLSPYHHLFLGLYSVQHYPANDAESFKDTETGTETETDLRALLAARLDHGSKFYLQSCIFSNRHDLFHVLLSSHV